MYSTANERGFDLNRFIGCLSATCRRDARDPVVSSAIQDRRRLACMRLYSTANDRVFVTVHVNLSKRFSRIGRMMDRDNFRNNKSITYTLSPKTYASTIS
ncbi:MAG: hypothetical protein LBP59_16685 [Planctomycetaceae bacterium]|nr:hypothetical protein [Planctomycetaceae bacterium]